MSTAVGMAAPAPDPQPAPSADAVLSAMTRLVADVLGAGGRLRFQQAERLCRLAHEMQGVLEPRTEDFLREDIHDDGIGRLGEPLPVLAGAVRGMAVRRWNPRFQQAVGDVGGNDQGEMLRGLFGALENTLSPRAESERAQVGEHEARELSLLAGLPEEMRTTCAPRIEYLTKRINGRQEKTDAVVHPDVERGLLARGDGVQEDAPARERPDGG